MPTPIQNRELPFTVSSEIDSYNNNPYQESNFLDETDLPDLTADLTIDDKKYLSFCNKKLYQLYCSQIRKIKINKISNKIKILELFNKYQNINRLDLGI